MLDGRAVIRRRQRVEARIHAERIGTVLDQRDRRDELVFVVEVAGIKHHRAVAQVMRQRRSQLPAFVGRKLWIAHAVRVTIEPTHAAEPAGCDRKTIERVHAFQVFRAEGDAGAAGRSISPASQDEVRGRAHLPVAEYHRRPALHDLHALDGIVQAEGRGALEERQRREAVDRRAVDLHGEERRVAAAGNAGDLDVGAGLAAARLRPQPRGDLQQIRGALRVGLLDHLLVRSDDRVGGVELLDSGGGGGHDHRLQRLRLARLLGTSGLSAAARRPLPVRDARHERRRQYHPQRD